MASSSKVALPYTGPKRRGTTWGGGSVLVKFGLRNHAVRMPLVRVAAEMAPACDAKVPERRGSGCRLAAADAMDIVSARQFHGNSTGGTGLWLACECQVEDHHISFRRPVNRCLRIAVAIRRAAVRPHCVRGDEYGQGNLIQGPFLSADAVPALGWERRVGFGETTPVPSGYALFLTRRSASMTLVRISLIRVRWPGPLDLSHSSTSPRT